MRIVYILLAFYIPIGEAHQVLRNIHHDMDVFLFIDYKIDVQWICKDLGEMIQHIILAFVAVRISAYCYGIKIIRNVLKGIFVYSLLEIVLYFLSFKTMWFSMVYYLVALCVVYFHYSRGKSKKA
jgi:hypothetical protein